MFQQLLRESSGYAVLSKNGAKGLAKIVKFEITQPKLLTNSKFVIHYNTCICDYYME